MNHLDRHFENEQSAALKGGKASVETIREAVRSRLPTRHVALPPPVGAAELQLGAKDFPKGKAAGPDMFPSEIRHFCAAAHFLLARPYTDMIEEAFTHRALKRVCVALLDKPAKDPRICDNRCPFAPLSTLMKLVGLVLVLRSLPAAERWLSADQYAYQQARSAEVLPSDLDHSVATDRRRNRVSRVAGLDISLAVESVAFLGLTRTLRRFIEAWLAGRIFRARLAKPSALRPAGIMARLGRCDRGGALSPVLWILRINRLTASAKSRGWRIAPYLLGGHSSNLC